MRSLAAKVCSSSVVAAGVSKRGQRFTMQVTASNSTKATPSPLITPVKVGEQQLLHRVALSAMTRLRCTPGVEAMNELNQLYYAQRSTPGGLIVTECTHISPEGRGYVRAPGIFNADQVEGWKGLVKAIHNKSGVVFVQLFHPGRVSHSSLLPQGQHPISAAAVGMAGQLYVEGGVKAAYEVPKAATEDDLKKVIKDFANAAKAAVKECGADGVEIHAGNGYLLQQFMSKKLGGQRSDAYGGASVANRCRLLLDVLDAVAAEVGPSRTAVKLQCGITFSDLIEPEEDVKETLDYLGPELSKRHLGYTCLSSLNSPPYSTNLGLPGPNVSFDVFKYFRPLYKGTLMVNGGLSIEAGEDYVAGGTADLVAYGVPFLANANLPELVAGGVKSAGLNPGGFQMQYWYGKNPADDVKGYTDWPLVKP